MTHPPMPTQAEVHEMGVEFFRLARLAIDDRPAATAKLCDYLSAAGSDSAPFERMWILAWLGPVVTADFIRDVLPYAVGPESFWTLPPAATSQAPSLLAALRALTYALNGDSRAVTDVVVAHYDTTGPDELLAMVNHSLVIFSHVIRKSLTPR